MGHPYTKPYSLPVSPPTDLDNFKLCTPCNCRSPSCGYEQRRNPASSSTSPYFSHRDYFKSSRGFDLFTSDWKRKYDLYDPKT